MEDWSARVPAADAKKAGNASEAARRIPSPPSLIGSDAWIHWLSVMSMFSMDPKPSLSRASYLSINVWSMHGQHRKVCRSFWELIELLSRMRASCFATFDSLSIAVANSAHRFSRHEVSASSVERGAPSRHAAPGSIFEKSRKIAGGSCPVELTMSSHLA